MARKASSHGRRSSAAVVAQAPLPHVMESENERDDAATITARAAHELEDAEKQEAERDAHFQEAEHELLGALESDGVSEHARKRQLTRLFDRFRYEYTQLSTRFRENLHFQRKIMDKCLEMKNELVMSAIKIKTAKQLQEEEMKNLVFYREECEHAWKAMGVCEERERDAMRIIDELKAEIDDLQGQLKAASFSDSHGLSPVRSPIKRLAQAVGSGVLQSSPAKSKGVVAADILDQPQLLSFDEWKLATRVWTPPADREFHKPPPPSQEELFQRERDQQIARCVSVPSLQPTAMERAATAVASSSPSRREQQRKAELDARRATTSVGSKRATPSSQPLPSVSTRKLPPS